MSQRIKLFTKVLIAEIEDLEDDLETGEQNLDKKHDAEKISDYVFLQNRVVLRQELANIKAILKDIMHDRNKSLTDAEAIRDHFSAVIEEAAARNNYGPAVVKFVQQKIDRVYGYLKE